MSDQQPKQFEEGNWVLNECLDQCIRLLRELEIAVPHITQSEESDRKIIECAEQLTWFLREFEIAAPHITQLQERDRISIEYMKQCARLPRELVIVAPHMFTHAFKELGEHPVRQGLSQEATRLAIFAFKRCHELDRRAMSKGKWPSFMNNLRIADGNALVPDFAENLKLCVWDEMMPLFEEAGNGNCAFALAQIDRSTKAFGPQRGMEETAPLRDQRDLKNNSEFFEKLGRLVTKNKKIPARLFPKPESNVDVPLFYWLPLSLWKKSAKEAFEEIQAIDQLLGEPEFQCRLFPQFENAMRKASHRLGKFKGW